MMKPRRMAKRKSECVNPIRTSHGGGKDWSRVAAYLGYGKIPVMLVAVGVAVFANFLAG